MSLPCHCEEGAARRSNLLVNQGVASGKNTPRNDIRVSGIYNCPVPAINRHAPDFELPDLDGVCHRLSDYQGRIVVVDFWSCECPHSERTDRSMMATFIQWVGEVVMLTIAANRSEPLELVRGTAEKRRLPLVLLDARHEAADLYAAQSTPHAFVIDREGILRYQGAVDNVAFRQRQATRFYVEEAVEALLEGRMPPVQETPAFGCAIVREI